MLLFIRICHRFEVQTLRELDLVSPFVFDEAGCFEVNRSSESRNEFTSDGSFWNSRIGSREFRSLSFFDDVLIVDRLNLSIVAFVRFRNR